MSKGTTEAATTTAKEPVVRKTFKAVSSSGRNNKSVDVRSIHSNVEQSRGRGVLSGMLGIGWKAFPGDEPAKKVKGSDVPDGGSVMDELLSDDGDKQVAMLNLLMIHQPETEDKSIWEMVESLDRNGQLQNVRLRPVYGDDGEPVANQFNTIAGARRCIARAIQYAMLNAFRNEDGTFRTLAAGEESNYSGLSDTDGLPTLEADIVEGKNAQAELMAALAENRDRLNQTPIDDALFFRRLKTEFGMKVPAIAIAFYGEEAKRKNKDQLVQQRLSLLRLSQEDQTRVHLGKLGVVNALDMLKKREAGDKGATATDKPGQGERVKMPSAQQAVALLAAIKPGDLKDEIKERFGKGKIWDLTRTEPVREFMARCSGVKYLTLNEQIEANAAEAAAAIVAEGKAVTDKAKKKKKAKAEAAAEAPAEAPAAE